MAYFPNGSSGEILDEQCHDCPLGYGWNDPDQGELFDTERIPKGCPTFLIQMQYNYDQINKKNKDLRAAMNVLIGDDGICKTRELLVEDRKECDNRV